jgi:IS30 family transposase
VENSIGRLRRSLPRKTDLKSITAADIKRYVQRLNNTPRKCLDFQTPAEAFLNSNQPLHFKRDSIPRLRGV